MSPTRCTVEGCKSKVEARGLCNRHYRRVLNHGTVEGTGVTLYRNISDAERFFHRVEKGADCWLWTGATDRDGYGSFRVGDRTIHAHRFSFELTGQTVPPGFHLDHVLALGCTSRACVNPDHLEVVTPGENQRRGRNGYGARTLCRNGKHDITNPANVYTKPRGGRECLGCRQDRETRRSRTRVPVEGSQGDER